MANIAHASLTGAELHEPKGAAAASSGTVYVADGAGSGAWSSIGTSSFTGMIADFLAPVAPTGWLEIDGSVVNTTTYPALFAVLSMASSATRSNGSAILTSIPSTSGMRAGYYVFGTGIASGVTIVSVDSGTQLTLSSAASSSGSSVIYVSPLLMNTNTITLPDLTQGRYRRSRTSSTIVGQLQADQNKAHTHTFSTTSGGQSVTHTHTGSGTTGTESQQHQHSYYQSIENGYLSGTGPVGVPDTNSFNLSDYNSVSHTHNYSFTTSTGSVDHTHSVSGTTASDGSTEARPLTISVMTCIKT